MCPDPKIFLCIPASVADAAAVKPKGIKMLLANGLITFCINGNPVFSNGENLMSTDELLANALGMLETCLFVSNNLCGK